MAAAATSAMAVVKQKKKKNKEKHRFNRLGPVRVGNQSKYFMRANGPAFVMKCAPFCSATMILFLFSVPLRHRRCYRCRRRRRRPRFLIVVLLLLKALNRVSEAAVAAMLN